MKIQRLVLVGNDKSTTVLMGKILTIPIKPGIPPGTRIVFPEEGDQGPTRIPGKSFHCVLEFGLTTINARALLQLQ